MNLGLFTKWVQKIIDLSQPLILHLTFFDVIHFAYFFRLSKALKGWDIFLLANRRIILTILDVLDVVRNWRMISSLALDHWELCEISINLKSSGFDGDLQINLCVSLTFFEKCKRNPSPQDAWIVWKWRCISSRHVIICTWTSQSPIERTCEPYGHNHVR